MTFILSTILIWTALFLLGGGAYVYTNHTSQYGRVAITVGWVTFGVYWLTMVPHFLFAKDSIIEGTLAAVALPLGIYVAYQTYTETPSGLVRLARAASIMGAVYLIIEQVEAARRWAIEMVTTQTVWIVERLVPHTLRIQEGPIYGYQSGIAIPDGPGGLLLTHIELACTGLGSIAIVTGLIAVLDEPVRKRLVGMIIATMFIYALNVVRTVFITTAYIGQWFQVFIPQVLSFTGYEDPRIVSFYIADKVIAQSLSLVVLIGIFVVLVRVYPSLYTLVDELQDLLPDQL